MDGQELTADQFLQQTDSSVMNSIQSFVQHANNLEETLGITSSWYLQNNLEFSSWKWENRQKSPKWSTFVTILKPRFCQVSLKITWKYFHFNYLNCTFTWNGSKLELLNVPESRNDPSRIFFGIFSRGKLTILRPPTFWKWLSSELTADWTHVRWLDCSFLRTLDLWFLGSLKS